MAVNELGRRVLVAAVGIPLAVWLLHLGGWPLTLVIAGLAGVGVMEVVRLGTAGGSRAFPWIALPATLALVILAGTMGSAESWASPAMAITLGTALLALAAAVFLRGPSGGPLRAVAITLFGVVFVGFPLAFALFLFTESIHLLVLPILVTWVGDSAAYFTGRSFGKRKLLPSVSPAKTVEGALGGIMGSTVGSVAYAWIFLGSDGVHFLPPVWALGLGLVLGAGAIVGDLAESLLKREAGVKDSGTLLPGHGGVLDRFDALLLNIPLAYFLLPFLLH